MFSWSRSLPLQIARRADPTRALYVVSDLHLGDGSPTDTFLGKDRELLAFLGHVRAEGAHLAIAGDAIDFHQALSLSGVLKAHSGVVEALAAMAGDGRVTYIWGNHDYDMSLFKGLLRFDVCSALELGEIALVQHGYQYDPFIGPNLEQSHLWTRLHHLGERVVGSWVRMPIEHHYTLANRIAFWCAHKVALVLRLRARVLARLGNRDAPEQEIAVEKYWTHAQLGDPQGMWDSVREAGLNGPWRWIVTGHSHLPGLVRLGEDRWFVNTGSWTFANAQYARWDGTTWEVRDWIRGRIYTDQLYRPLMEARFEHLDFLDWWRQNYLGWLRYRVPEEWKRPPLDFGAGGEWGTPGALRHPREGAEPTRSIAG